MQVVRFDSQKSAPETKPVYNMESNARKHITNPRFGDRRKRIDRRTERDKFRCIIMPALYVIDRE